MGSKNILHKDPQIAKTTTALGVGLFLDSFILLRLNPLG